MALPDVLEKGVGEWNTSLFYVKQMFGYGKVGYHSLGKNENRLTLLFGFANLLRAESCSETTESTMRSPMPATAPATRAPDCNQLARISGGRENTHQEAGLHQCQDVPGPCAEGSDNGPFTVKGDGPRLSACPLGPPWPLAFAWGLVSSSRLGRWWKPQRLDQQGLDLLTSPPSRRQCACSFCPCQCASHLSVRAYVPQCRTHQNPLEH